MEVHILLNHFIRMSSVSNCNQTLLAQFLPVDGDRTRYSRDGHEASFIYLKYSRSDVWDDNGVYTGHLWFDAACN